ncbi:DUF455 family protein [Paenibacillus montanisoli]|uniref:DUF455 domain-containing protein n=1 Tax=Paenibacillus montanisoli TaxID=2081970 RepID=A0A328U5G3_9BACL|nr:DUF455 family protein [Paenibacillus montanisoli]RAP75146.1 hypothetical protein DL346_17330 [Paenibacillus montanisoli]
MSLEQVLVMGMPGKRTVEEASDMVKRFYLVERELMRTLGGYHVNIANWELKKKLPHHIWQDSLRADALRTRVLEMRYPRRDVDQEHDPYLSKFLASLIRCNCDVELITGVYFVAKEALVEAYETYLRDADPLDDAPTVEFMSRFPMQIRSQLDEIQQLFAQIQETVSGEEIQAWRQALQQFLKNIGGVIGQGQRSDETPSEVSKRPEYVPPTTPRRDPRFTPAVYHMPPRHPEKFIERQIWQGINHVNEIWAAEIPLLVLWKWDNMPWDFYLDCSRWAFDESRHCMMGEERMKAWGFEVGLDYPVVADHYISTIDNGEVETLALLHAFESGGPAWKAGLKAEFEAAGDTASSQDFDYDWADESIHLAYGHKWVLHRLNGDLDVLEDLKEELIERWHDWMVQKHQEWDYEPFTSRIQARIAEIEAGAANRHE